MTEKEFVNKYLGIPFVDGGRNPNTGLDCWGFIMCSIRDLYNVEIFDPQWRLDGVLGMECINKYCSEREGKIVVPVETPEFGDMFLFNASICGFPIHAGIYLKNKRFIHCTLQGIVTSQLKTFSDKLIKIYRVRDDLRNN